MDEAQGYHLVGGPLALGASGSRVGAVVTQLRVCQENCAGVGVFFNRRFSCSDAVSVPHMSSKGVYEGFGGLQFSKHWAAVLLVCFAFIYVFLVSVSTAV